MFLKDTLSENSPNAAGNAAGTLIVKGLDAVELIAATITTLGATGGTLNITLQDSDDNGASWHDWFRSADITAGSAAAKFTVTQHLGSGVPVTIGGGTTPALAKGTVRPGPVRPWMRVLFEAGAGTSAGAAQAITITGYKPSG